MKFVRRDVAGLQQHPDDDGQIVADNISSLLQRVSANSVQDIDRLIDELKEFSNNSDLDCGIIIFAAPATDRSVGLIADDLTVRAHFRVCLD